MWKIVFSFSLVILLSSCSLYRSNVRKDFESQAPDSIKTTALGQCQVLGALPAWLEKEFSGGGAELLVSDNEIEVWKKTRGDGHVTLQSFRPAEHGTESCRREFTNETEWGREASAYLILLETTPAL